MKRIFGLLLGLLLVATAHALTTASAAVSWSAPAANADGSPLLGPVTYNLYQGLAGSLSKVQSGLTSTAVVVTTGLTPNTTQCFAVTAVVLGVESAQSTAACGFVTPPTPGSPGNVVVVIQIPPG